MAVGTIGAEEVDRAILLQAVVCSNDEAVVVAVRDTDAVFVGDAQLGAAGTVASRQCLDEEYFVIDKVTRTVGDTQCVLALAGTELILRTEVDTVGGDVGGILLGVLIDVGIAVLVADVMEDFSIDV